MVCGVRRIDMVSRLLVEWVKTALRGAIHHPTVLLTHDVRREA